jgi:8-oxo-dGTP pyrophosphatase MutT (NUDIX family)
MRPSADLTGDRNGSVAPTRGGPQPIPRPPGSRPGVPAPWADLSDADRVITADRLRRVFAGRVGHPSQIEVDPDDGTDRASSVLAPFYEDAGGLFVILTRRGQRMRSHRGEVSFPGGLSEPGETLVEAALRETEEEIGLLHASVDVLGELDHLRTIRNRSFIVPHVGLVAGGRPELKPNPAEVDAVLLVPVAELLLDEVYREERWFWEGEERPIFFFELVGDTVWGATAAMLRQLLALALDRSAGIEHP